MTVVEAIILGLLQGLTEFIPVSSSGHLVIAQSIFSGTSNHLFLEWINIGTLAALLVYFRQRIAGIIKDILINKKYALARNILLTAIPAGAVGFLAADFIAETSFFNSITTVLFTLAIVGAVMVGLERLPKASAVESGEKLSPLRALTIGVVQVLALIPGVSRSGSTIITGRLMGLSPASAAEYSFLASLPIMCGVMFKLLISSDDRSYFAANFDMLVLSNVVAFISGLIAVGFLMRYLSKHSLAVFGWYRIGLAAVIGLFILL